jgi:L-alanine-DL-glutamate epimerase-like enolase superfamily enzyme
MGWNEIKGYEKRRDVTGRRRDVTGGRRDVTRVAVTTRVTGCAAELWRYKFDTPMGGSMLTSVDMIVVTLRDSDGATGTGFSYVIGGGGEPVLGMARMQLERFVKDQEIAAPAALWRRLAASLNRLGRGVGYNAICAIDIAAWDLNARSRNLPLGVALGGEPRVMPVYTSGGFGAFISPEEAVERAKAALARGVRGVKIRVAGAHADLARMRAVKDVLPPGVHLMADANERCDLLRAKWLAAACAEHGMLWLEEPLPAYDYAGFDNLARTSPVAIATGEHLQGAMEFHPLLESKSIAVAQPDPAMMGGITEILRLCAIAEAAGVVVAPHFNPALFIHVAAAAPAMRWLEDFPVLEHMFAKPLAWDKNGDMAMPTGPGHGIEFHPDARGKYLVKE